MYILQLQKFTFQKFFIIGNGNQLLRYRKYIAGSWYDEVLERKAYNIEKTGEFLKFLIY
jgi:hypothetical protein